MGCTKKHAKCSWKDVREEELRTNRPNTRTESYSPEHGGGANDQAELATPDASASSHHSPTSLVQPVPLEPPLSTSSRRELDLLPPPSSLATALTTGVASPSIYASVERKSEAFPATTMITSSNPKTPNLDHSTTTTKAAATSTIGQQLQDAANGLAAAHRSVFMPPKQNQSRNVEHNGYDDEDEGDRLQALAAQVYRSASAQQHRS